MDSGDTFELHYYESAKKGKFAMRLYLPHKR